MSHWETHTYEQQCELQEIYCFQICLNDVLTDFKEMV